MSAGLVEIVNGVRSGPELDSRREEDPAAEHGRRADDVLYVARQAKVARGVYAP